jgi:hypothetical protein
LVRALAALCAHRGRTARAGLARGCAVSLRADRDYAGPAVEGSGKPGPAEVTIDLPQVWQGGSVTVELSGGPGITLKNNRVDLR